MAKDPTLEEIRQVCLEIQAGWSPQERWKRLRADLRPTYRMADGERGTISAEAYRKHHDRTPEERQEAKWD